MATASTLRQQHTYELPLAAFLPSSSSERRTGSNSDLHHGVSSVGIVTLKHRMSRERHRGRSSKLSWPVFGSILGLLLVVSLCFDFRRRGAVGVTEKRRLAEGGEQPQKLSGAEETCENILSRGPFQSPSHSPNVTLEGVNSSLETIQAEKREASPDWVTSGASSTPSAAVRHEQPSTEVTTTGRERVVLDLSHSETLSEFGDSDTRHSPSHGERAWVEALFKVLEGGRDISLEIPEVVGTPQVTGGALQSKSHLKRPAPPEESGEPKGSRHKVGRAVSMAVHIDSDDELPSTSQGATGCESSQSEQAGLKEKHPFVRLPVVARGVIPRSFNMEVLKLPYPLSSSLSNPLSDVRQLLLLPELSKCHLDYLMIRAEKLATYASHKMTTSIPCRDVSKCIAKLGCRFLMFDALFSIARVAGMSMEKQCWWKDFAAKIPNDCNCSSKRVWADRSAIALAARLKNTIEMYKKGELPSEEEVLSLKLQLFSETISGATYFKRRQWGPWREDARWKPESKD